MPLAQARAGRTAHGVERQRAVPSLCSKLQSRMNGGLQKVVRFAATLELHKPSGHCGLGLNCDMGQVEGVGQAANFVLAKCTKTRPRASSHPQSPDKHLVPAEVVASNADQA